MPHTREGVTSILTDHHTLIRDIDCAQGEASPLQRCCGEWSQCHLHPKKVRGTTKSRKYSHLPRAQGITVKSLQSGQLRAKLQRAQGWALNSVKSGPSLQRSPREAPSQGGTGTSSRRPLPSFHMPWWTLSQSTRTAP